MTPRSVRNVGWFPSPQRMHPLTGKLVLPVLWLGLGAYLLAVGASTDVVGDSEPFGPGGFPMLVGASLVLLGLWLGGGEVRSAVRQANATESVSAEIEQPAEVAESQRGEPVDGHSAWRPFAVIAIVAAYLLALSVLGFLIATVLTVAAIATLTARRFSWALSVVYPVVVSVVLYLVFAGLLNIRLP